MFGFCSTIICITKAWNGHSTRSTGLKEPILLLIRAWWKQQKKGTRCWWSSLIKSMPQMYFWRRKKMKSRTNLLKNNLNISKLEMMVPTMRRLPWAWAWFRSSITWHKLWPKLLHELLLVTTHTQTMQMLLPIMTHKQTTTIMHKISLSTKKLWINRSKFKLAWNQNYLLNVDHLC